VNFDKFWCQIILKTQSFQVSKSAVVSFVYLIMLKDTYCLLQTLKVTQEHDFKLLWTGAL